MAACQPACGNGSKAQGFLQGRNLMPCTPMLATLTPAELNHSGEREERKKEIRGAREGRRGAVWRMQGTGDSGAREDPRRGGREEGN
jgi:ribosome assembly protein YihI (activator of Der GTPase)